MKFNIFNKKQPPPPTKTEPKSIKGMLQKYPQRVESQDIQDLRQALEIAQNVYNPQYYRLQEVYMNAVWFDAHLATVINKRHLALLSSELVIKDSNDNVIEQSLTNSTKFQNFVKSLIDSVFYGYTAGEIYTDNNQFDYWLIPREHFNPESCDIIERPTDIKGTPIIDFDNTFYIVDADNFGLLLKAMYYCIMKRNAISDWADTVQMFGSPIMNYTYDGNDPKIKQDIATGFKSLGSNGMVNIPAAVKSEVIFPNPSGDLQKNFHDAMNAELSKLILGQTMTTENGSSRSQAEVHQSQQDMIFRSDQKLIENWLNDNFVKYLSLLGIQEGKFEYMQQDSTSLIEKLEADAKLKEIIPNIAPEYFTEKYGVKITEPTPPTPTV